MLLCVREQETVIVIIAAACGNNDHMTNACDYIMNTVIACGDGVKHGL